ncbi:quinohemoprotein amine dehydrogenase subunit alpha [Novosphingobium sp. Chol11]|uniref:quinohemoprotein amine dehydrogenase subunit alpha n=1 Tax=Novosphingobium sp. Chol11 TaxID=1385763 RepID=UPI0025E71E06|nr:quinohemoprotein amine dehydrogenase subunit alpha [Novosphingobium sp. Chol11]
MDDPVAATVPFSPIGQCDASPAAASPPPAGKALRHLTRALLFGAVSLFSATTVIGQANFSAEEAVEKEEGIPVTDGLTREKCGTCHTADAKGNLSRISWVRTTPEGWDSAIKRMVRLNGAVLSPNEARHIVRYLADTHGLAPEEAKPIQYLVEKRLIDETNIPSESVRTSCAACHAFAQPLSWRRSSAEWKNLQDFHVALYSQADAQYRRPATDRPGAVFGTTEPIVNKPGTIPVMAGQVALEYLRKNAPLKTPEWTAWEARKQAPRLAGKWLASAWLPGKGLFYGTFTVAPGAAEGEFKTETALRSLADGDVLNAPGGGLVYGGYAWRGRAVPAGAPAGPGAFNQPLRSTMLFNPDRKSASGRWFWGDYQEFGYDVTLTRADGSPVIGAIWPAAIKGGAKAQTMHIYGDAFPAGLTAKDIDLGAGVTVTKLVSASPGEVVVTVDAAADVKPSVHDVSVASAVLVGALPVYQKIEYLKVTPETSVSRLGSGKRTPGYAQFEAWGFDAGADGKAHTADDVKVGVVPADFTVDEFQATYYDDDKDFVGKLSPAGFFTPASDGPNPERSGNRNNYGDIWVVATAKTEKDATGQPLTARSYLVVTIPAYKRWDNPGVSQ